MTVSTLTTGALPSADRSRRRTLTEARREQNRLNQRVFRQRQRTQRRDGQHRRPIGPAKNLELQARPDTGKENAPIIIEPVDPLESVLSISTGELEPLQDGRSFLDVDVNRRLSPLASSDSIPSHSSYDSDVANIAPSLYIPYRMGQSFSDLDFVGLSFPSDLGPVGFPSDGYLDLNVLTTERVPQKELNSLGSCFDSPNISWPPVEDTQLWPSFAPLEPFPSASYSSLSRAFAGHGFSLEQVITAGLDALLSNPKSHPSTQDQTSPTCLPSPRMTCVEFHANKMVYACVQNAVSMGFRAEDVIIPRCFAQSPFFRIVKPDEDPKKILAAVTRPTTPTNLKPTLPQLLYPHPAFMDLIPMPTFRARAITLAATQPHLIDIAELKRDMFVEEGFVHWSAKSSSMGSDWRDEGQGQPWDLRSWEVAPWFLRKWRMLTDGEDGDVWKQSSWWQRARGEVGGGM